MRAKELSVCGSAAIVVLLVAQPVTVDAATTVPKAAYWGQHDEIDYLDNLPRTYNCDDLYYKYRDVLLRVGARPGMNIYA